MPGVGSNLVRYFFVTTKLRTLTRSLYSKITWVYPSCTKSPSMTPCTLSPRAPGTLSSSSQSTYSPAQAPSPRPTCSLRSSSPSRLLNSSMEVVAPDPADLDSSLPANRADIEIMPIPHNCTARPHTKIGIFSFMTTLIHPKSVGAVRLACADAHARPHVELGLLTHADDRAVLRKAVQLSLQLGEKMRTQGYAMADLQVPESAGETDVDKYIRAEARSVFHYTSTCRMAPETDVRPGVVDDELRVHGVLGLRVCDTSVFPEILGAHTMAPAVVVAEKCADLIKRAAEK